jgi:hypothetical protein
MQGDSTRQLSNSPESDAAGVGAMTEKGQQHAPVEPRHDGSNAPIPAVRGTTFEPLKPTHRGKFRCDAPFLSTALVMRAMLPDRFG